jgi:hypothetical protein
MRIVYHLTAQFPGPTTPRDFVTLLLTSDSALTTENGEKAPRHFMVVSKPCNHPDCPPRDGFIRGYYESVEFIREIPRQRHGGPRASQSMTDLPAAGSRKRADTSSLSREAVLRSAQKNHHGEGTEEIEEGRKRGKTISFAESRGSDAKGEGVDNPDHDEEDELNPVEWIMITRSDPGGSVPRFMVERGTPGGIVADASKFLDWACGKDIEELEELGKDEDQTEDIEGEEHHARAHNHEKDLHDYQTNGHLSGLEGVNGNIEKDTVPAPADPPAEESGGLYGMVAGAAAAASNIVAAHAPAAIANYLPGHSSDSYSTTQATSITRQTSQSTLSTISSDGSFASAVEAPTTSTNAQHLHHRQTSNVGSASTASSAIQTRPRAHSQAQSKELARFEERRRKAEEKLLKTREKETAREQPPEKLNVALAKAEEKHAKEIARAEEKHRKEMQRLEQKQLKEEQKRQERVARDAEREEKTVLARELDGLRSEIEGMRAEREGLLMRISGLERENEALRTRAGDALGGSATTNGADPVVEAH